jgi:PPP family 3-phenylpropionic acid transporter
MTLRGMYGFLFLAMGAQIPFLSLYFKKVLDFGQDAGGAVAFIGFVFFIQPLLGLLANPLFGLAGDRFSMKKKLLFVSGLAITAGTLLMALPAAGFPLAGKTLLLLATGLGAMITGFFLSAVFPLLDADTLDWLNGPGRNPSQYGRFRMIGTIAYIVGALGSGLLLGFGGDIRWLMPVLVGAYLLFALSALPTVGQGIRKVELPLKSLLADKPFFLFLIYLFLFSFGHNAAYTFTPWFMDDYRVNYLFIGLAFGLSAVLEVPMMGLAPNIQKRFGVEKMIVAGSLILIAKLALLYFLAPLHNSWLMIGAMSLHGIGYALQFNGVIQFVNRSAHPDLRGTYMQMMSVIGLTLPAVLSSLFSAFIIARLGSGAMIGINALIALSGVVFLGIVLATRSAPAAGQTGESKSA